MKMPEYFVDLEGKIPAKNGDRIALVKYPTNDEIMQQITQLTVANRPRLVTEDGESALEFDGAEENDGDYMLGR